MAARLAVIDYDTGNLHSACKGLEHVGASVEIVEHPEHLAEFDGLVLPGDGAFDPAMRELRARGFAEPLWRAFRQGQPFLGICIGLQLLFEHSEEGSETGLGLIQGGIRRLAAEPGLTIPHMGWNQLHLTQPAAPLWQDIAADTWAYFVHSYSGFPQDPGWIAATVQHGSQTVTAAIARGSVMATQFHPEKSGEAGLKMLANFVKLVEQKANIACPR